MGVVPHDQTVALAVRSQMRGDALRGFAAQGFAAQLNRLFVQPRQNRRLHVLRGASLRACMSASSCTSNK